jgi:hypothetical protein
MFVVVDNGKIIGNWEQKYNGYKKNKRILSHKNNCVSVEEN